MERVGAAAHGNLRSLRCASDVGWRAGTAILALGVSPIWNNTEYFYAAAKGDEGLALTVNATCDSSEDVASVQRTIDSIVTLAQNTLDSYWANHPTMRLVDFLMESADSILNATEVSSISETQLQIASQVDIDASMASVVLDMTNNARQAARRTANMNNMKQILLAMHNYHDVYGSFPPAVIKHRTASGRGHRT